MAFVRVIFATDSVRKRSPWPAGSYVMMKGSSLGKLWALANSFLNFNIRRKYLNLRCILSEAQLSNLNLRTNRLAGSELGPLRYPCTEWTQEAVILKSSSAWCSRQNALSSDFSCPSVSG